MQIYPQLGLDDFLSYYFANKSSERLFFIQVGANDGVTNDPLYPYLRRYGWPGLLIEPQPEAFAELRMNYQGRTNLIFENVAVATTRGTQPLYRLKPALYEQYHLACGYNPTGFASFDRLHVIRELEMNFGERMKGLGLLAEDCVTSSEVPCWPLQALLDKHSIACFDLLQVDTEGFDYEVMKMIDLAKYRPALIIYEHVHLSAADRSACWARLNSLGYRQFTYRGNTVGFGVQE